MIDAQLQMNLFDAIVLGVLFLSALISFFRGFIRELLSLMAWVGAAFITLYFVLDVAKFLEPYVKKPMVAAIFATLGTYFVALISISILNSILVRYLKSGSDVGAFDNVFGLMFGVLKGSLIIALGYFLLTVVMGPNKEEYPDWIKTAHSLPMVEKGTGVVVAMMPSYLKELATFANKEEEPFNTEQPLEETPAPESSGTPTQGFDQLDMQKFQDILEDVEKKAKETPADEGSAF